MALAGSLALGFASCRAEPPPPRAPNLLLVTVDTLRADALSCYGGEPNTGTSMCDIGRFGTRYGWALSAAPSTAPAIVSLLTSLYPSQHGVTQFASTRLRDDVLTVAEVLSAAGYTTGAFVSNPVLHPARAIGQGFGVYDAPRARGGAARRTGERDARETTDAALAWLREVPEPWFVWIHYQDPHGPYAPPGASPARDNDAGRRLPVLEDHSGLSGIPAYQALPGVAGVATYRERYRAEIRYLDLHIGRLLADLDALPHPPAVLLTADHGEAFGEDDYWFAHGHSVALEQLRVPLFWRPAATSATDAPPTVDHTPVSTIDVAATLVSEAGLDVPDEFRGQALGRPEAQRDETPRTLYAEHRLRAAVIAGQHYYARDRRDLSQPAPDEITGGLLHALPPRSANLKGDRLPPYLEPENGGARGNEVAPELRTAGALEAILARYLEQLAVKGSGSGSESPDNELPEATRAELRELGYLQ